MSLIMKKNPLTKKRKTNVHHINIERWEKKNYYFAKTIVWFQVLEIYFSNYQKIIGPIQVLASALKKHNYINLTFESNANSS